MTLVLCALLLSAVAWAGPPEGAQPKEIPKHLKRVDTKDGLWGALVVVRGSENPELIPENAAWKHVFASVHEAKTKNESLWRHFKRQLSFSQDEENLLVRATQRWHEREEGLQRAASARAALLQAEGKGNVDEGTLDLLLENRKGIMELAHGLMAKLSPDAQHSLLEFKAQTVKGLTIYVPEKSWHVHMQ